MRCGKCGTEGSPGKKFCAECGSPLSKRCSNCNSDNAPGAKFCADCGSALGDGGPAATNNLTTNDLARSPRAYTPKHLADKILQSKAALEGERKQVTVLFAEVKGSIELAEQMDTEERAPIMNRFFHILSDSV